MDLHVADLKSSVLILTHLKKDAIHISKVLVENSIESVTCSSLEEAATLITGAGLVLITEEVLHSKDAILFNRGVREQPSWSAIPILIFYGGDSGRNSFQKKAEHPLQQFSDLNFLRRPVNTQTLISAVKSSLRDRRRQFEIKSLLETQRKSQILLENSAREILAEKAKTDALISESPSAIALMRGPDLIFEIANRKWSELVSRREYIGRSYVDVYPELIDSAGHKSLQDIFLTGTPFTAREMKLLVTSPQGSLEDQYFDYSNVRIMDVNGAPYGVYCNATNVTDRVLARKNLERAKEQLEVAAQHADHERAKFAAAFESVADGIFIFDSNGNPVYMNDAAAKVFGEKVAADVRKRFEFYFERLDLYELDGTLVPLSEWPVAKALRGESFRDWQLKAHRKDTNERWIWSSSGELAKQAGSDIGLGVVVLRDITKQKNAEYELKAAKDEAERANQTKSYFLANMSHEIRTPLGAILGFTDLLKDQGIAASEREQFLDTISKNGKALTRIIDDILDLAKVESGKLEVEKIEFSLQSLINEVTDLFRERTRSKGLYLVTNIVEDAPDLISSDPTRLRQIMINLIGNAVKFTNTGGITIGVSLASREENKLQLKIEICDTGVGIPVDQRSRLFQPFSQADNTTSRKYGGTGLGLVLSERLANALGGQIRIDTPETGLGSKFTLHFAADTVFVLSPIANESETPTPSRPLSGKSVGESLEDASIATVELPLNGIRVLLTDDSADNLFLVSRILTKAGALVSTAENGAVACRKAFAESFDVILMDIQMPEMDGHQATRHLRAAGYAKPIIALTAHAMAEERASTIASGCNGHLTKPINKAELISEIKRLAQLPR